MTFGLTPFFQSNGWLKGWWRDLALPRMGGLPWVGQQMALTMAGLKGGFLWGRWGLE